MLRNEVCKNLGCKRDQLLPLKQWACQRSCTRLAKMCRSRKTTHTLASESTVYSKHPPYCLSGLVSSGLRFLLYKSSLGFLCGPSLPWYPWYLEIYSWPCIWRNLGSSHALVPQCESESMVLLVLQWKKRAQHHRGFKRSFVTWGVTCKCGHMLFPEIISAGLCMGRHLQKHNVTLFPMLLVELSMTCLILLGSRCPFSFQISCCVAMDTQLLRKTLWTDSCGLSLGALWGWRQKQSRSFSLFQIYTNTNNCIERGQLSCNASQEGKQPENVCSWAPFYALRHVCGVPSFLLSAARWALAIWKYRCHQTPPPIDSIQIISNISSKHIKTCINKVCLDGDVEERPGKIESSALWLSGKVCIQFD